MLLQIFVNILTTLLIFSVAHAAEQEFAKVMSASSMAQLKAVSSRSSCLEQMRSGAIPSACYLWLSGARSAHRDALALVERRCRSLLLEKPRQLQELKKAMEIIPTTSSCYQDLQKAYAEVLYEMEESNPERVLLELIQ